MRRAGMLLIVLGVVAVVLSGVKVSNPREVARVGGVRVTIQEDRRPLLPRWIGVTVLVAGVVLVAAGRPRTAA